MSEFRKFLNRMTEEELIEFSKLMMEAERAVEKKLQRKRQEEQRGYYPVPEGIDARQHMV